MMDWASIAAAVGRSAPLLGAALAGPAGASIGTLVASALGTPATAEHVGAALAGDPALSARLVEIELQHKRQLQTLQLEAARADLAGIADARARDIALAKLGRSNVRADVMVIAAALGLLACLGSLVIYRQAIPPEAVGIISTIAGLFGACLKDAFSFEFGSSRSSLAKDATISNLTR